MNALKLAKDPAEKGRYSATVARLLKDAEDIKAGKNWRQQSSSNRSSVSTNGTAKELREPLSTRQLPKSEQILLLKASYLNGFKFPPWTSSPAPSEFELAPNSALFT